MSTALPAVGRTTAAIAATLLQNQVNPETGGGVSFLSFDSKRTGEWLFGAGKEPCTGEVFSLDLTSLKHGWILWHAKKANRKLVPINAPLPTPQEPIEYVDNKGRTQVDDPNEGRALEGTFEDGTRFLFETNSYGGRKAVDSVLQQLFAKAAAGSPFLFPHIALESESYDHKEYGKLWNPVLSVVAWYDENGNEEAELGQIAAPEKKVDKAPEKVVEQEQEETPEPATRRRRRG
jgi:hypothetical protein